MKEAKLFIQLQFMKTVEQMGCSPCLGEALNSHKKPELQNFLFGTHLLLKKSLNNQIALQKLAVKLLPRRALGKLSRGRGESVEIGGNCIEKVMTSESDAHQPPPGLPTTEEEEVSCYLQSLQ